MALCGRAFADNPEQLLDLSLEELGQVQVSSVSRRAERVNDVPASVYVITREQIQRSGATSIPEALRLAPGVEVARNGAHSWTISMRGFSNNLSNKLLVLIDGRSVYSPLFAGVFWDAQDTLLDLVDRIEVIAGPGGAIWGSNAVNGVINIITRSAWDTQGGLVQVAAGNEEELTAGLRYGGTIGGDLAYRGYVKHFEQDDARLLSGGGARDRWDMQQAGFRVDWAPSPTSSLSVQGNVYDADESALVLSDFTLGTLPKTDVPGTVDASGHNLLARWERQLGGGAWLQLQGYYDHTERDTPGNYAERRNTGDMELVHNLRQRGRHALIWGAGVRVTGDHIDNTTLSMFVPASRTDQTYSAFIQDRITLKERWLLTVGTKLEHNDYSDFENQPTVRLAWLPTDRQTLWTSVSRAVRIPARLNQDLSFTLPVAVPNLPVPFYVNVRGTSQFKPERLVAYEAGYRFGFSDHLTADLALYLHDYDQLMTNRVTGGPELVPGPSPYLILHAVQSNDMRGQVYGGTLDVKWQVLPEWRVEFQYSHTDFDLELAPSGTDPTATNVGGNTPKNQAALYSYLQITRNLNLYTGIRHVDRLPNQGVPSYTALDVNLNWQVMPALTASLTARDVGDPRHPEFGGGSEIERSLLARLTWQF